jgi:PAS domain S-box-containing protein
MSSSKQTDCSADKQMQEFRTMVEELPDAVARYDTNRNLIYANPAFRQLTGTTTHQQSNQPPANEDCSYSYLTKVQEVLDSGMNDELECIWQSPTGNSITAHVRFFPERDASGKIVGVLSIGHDISDLKETEHHLRESRALLRELTARLKTEEVRVRKEIAHEMHEEYGQQLSALRMSMALMRKRFGEGCPGLQDDINDALELLDNTIVQVREMVSTIHPSALNWGIASALRWVADECLADAGIHYEVWVDDSIRDISDTFTNIFSKIVQIALSNVRRHAEAKNVVISFQKNNNDYRLEVRDDGKGFDLDRSRSESMGLVEMEELSNMMNSEIVFLSEPGKGTVIEVCFPTAPLMQQSLFESA